MEMIVWIPILALFIVCRMLIKQFQDVWACMEIIIKQLAQLEKKQGEKSDG